MATLQHPYDDHALNLCLVHEDCTGLRCKGCNGQIRGPAYCCEECDFFLHKSCAELPSKIPHPFHQQHPLQMDSFSPEVCDVCKCSVEMRFRCFECKTGFCFSCIAATMPDEGSHTRPVDDLTTHHVAHQHPLAPCHIGMQSRIECKLCMNTISGEAFGSYQCFFFMHKNCTESPQEVRHPFHPQHPLTLLRNILDVSEDLTCHICHDRCRESIYSCNQCQFNLGYCCAISTIEFPVSEDSGLFIDHFAHQHQLKYFHVKVENRIPCKACGENISGEVYGCTDCLLFFHKSCTQLPRKIDHLLHEEHSSLALVPTSPDDFDSLFCSSCGRSIQSYALAFSCQVCEFVLDVKCALETLNFLNQGGSVQIEHHLHDHVLQLCYWKSTLAWYRCGACRGTVQGIVYDCKACSKFSIHRSCADLPSEMQHPCHAQHEVTLHPGKDYYSCSLCFKYNTGIRFRCKKCDFCSDIPCAYRNPPFKHPLHEHSLCHFVEIGGCYQCKACGKSCNVDIYRCLQCNFFIHRDCLPQLPSKIKHKSHLHQLTFSEYFVEDDLGECYCDFCAKRRNQDLSVYYCKECPAESTVVAHIGCTLSGATDPVDTVLVDTVRKILKGAKNPAIDRLNEQITSVQAQVDALSKKLDGKNEELRRLKLERAALLEVEEQKMELEEFRN